MWGVIGNDILREDMVFGVDRGAGYAWLASDASFHRPVTGEDYITLGGGPRVLAQVGDHTRYLRIALTSPRFALHYALWPDRSDDDPFAGGGEIAIPSLTALGHRISPVEASDYSYGDADGVLDAVLRALRLRDRPRPAPVLLRAPRRRPRTPRACIARWGPTPCPNVGCVSLEVIDRDDRHGVRVTRDVVAAHMPLEVTLAMVDMPDAPRFAVTMPGDVRAWTAPIDERYLGHRFEVVDMSPFPPLCEARTGDKCVDVHEIAGKTR